MKKILLALIAMVACTTINAKVVKITLKDKSMQVYTSSQLSAIDFSDNGTVTITSYDGNVLMKDAEVDDVNISEEPAITSIRTMEMEFNPGLIAALVDVNSGLSSLTNESISTRAVHQINFVYPSTDPYGEPVTQSGAMWIPDNIWNAEDDSEGIILMNHFTISSSNMLPSKGGMAFLEAWFLANPLMPNYIVTESDFYGWGATERFPQAFCQGDVNGYASVDCLLATRKLLRELSIKSGILNFNVGYSSGGFDALATQRVRDMEFPHNYDVCFDKTFAGGGPADMKLSYTEMVRVDTTAMTGFIPILMVSTNETQKLGLNYEDMFAPDISTNIDDLVLSKRVSPFSLTRRIGAKRKIHEILAAPYVDLESAESKFMQDVYEKISLNNGWIANPSQRVYIYHSRQDDIVPLQSGRSLLKQLKACGYEPSIIPGATNLQTNFVMPMGHMEGVLPWFVQTLAAIKAWPIMYYEGELNADYKFLAEQTKNDPIAILRYFDAIGFDCRGLIKQLLDLNPKYLLGDVDEASLEADLTIICEQIGITYEELCQMMEDSGIDLKTFVIELARYMNENPGQDIFKSDIRTLRSSNDKVNPVEEYENQLYDWLEANGVK
jgi:hypothetical protein